MRRALRLLRVWPALIAVALLLPGSAAADLVDVASVSGDIIDATPTRVLYVVSDGTLHVHDVSNPSDEAVPVASGRAFRADSSGARLIPGGVLYPDAAPGAPFGPAHLVEWRNGATEDLGALNSDKSIVVAGNYAIWNDGTTLTRRDVTTGHDDTVATDAGNTDNDVVAGGDVVYWTSPSSLDPYVVKQWHNGVTTTVSGPTADRSFSPLTDGTITVFHREQTPCCDSPSSVVFNAGSGEATLPDTAGPIGGPQRVTDYTVAGGWIAYTAAGRTQVHTRAPDGAPGTVTPVSTQSHFIKAVSPAGQVVYERDDPGDIRTLMIGSSGQHEIPVESQFLHPNYQQWHAFWASGHWYIVRGGVLRRVDIGTEIASAPPEFTSNPSAPFKFASTSPNPAFTCSIDQNAPVPCDGDSFAPTVGDGLHTLVVQSRDQDTNEIDADGATAKWTVDTSPPDAFGISAPADGTTVFDAQPALSWQAASDGGSGIASYVVTIDGHAFAPLGPDTTSFTPASALSDGSHTWSVTATNRAGLSRTSREGTFVVDTTPGPRVNQIFVSSNPVLTGQTEHFDSDGPDAGPVYGWHYEWDLDGNGSYETDTGTSGKVDTVYDTPGDRHVTVRVSGSGGRVATAEVVIHVMQAPLDGPPGITINDGAQYTNDRNVTLTVRWPWFATSMLASNDGGFVGAQPQDVATHVPWQLDSSGAERLPRTVYVRFSGGLAGNETYTDDIILDETAPQVLSATLRPSAKKGRYVARVRGRDGTSGLASLQVTANRAHPGAKHRYVRRLGLKSSRAPRWARVIDRAGNGSRWHRLKLIRLH